MAERLLCDAGLRVTLDGGGDRTLIAVRDGAAIRFWTETAILEELLGGGCVQLSAHGGYCTVSVDDDQARLEFGAGETGRKRCAFPKTDLAAALAMVRSLPSPDADELDAALEDE